MDLPRGSPTALSPPGSRSYNGRLVRSTSQTSFESGQTRTSTAIPGAVIDDVPPALRPSRRICDLNDGVDIARKYQMNDCPVGRAAQLRSKLDHLQWALLKLSLPWMKMK